MNFFEKLKACDYPAFDAAFFEGVLSLIVQRQKVTQIDFSLVASNFATSALVFYNLIKYWDIGNIPADTIMTNESFQQFMMGMALMTKFMYPIIEQLDKLVDDKIYFLKESPKPQEMD